MTQKHPGFSSLVGKTLTSVENVENEIIRFTEDNGTQFELYHSQDCCESVTVESVVGDLSDLVGTPILMAEEAKSDPIPDSEEPRVDSGEDNLGDSYSWAFYRLSTIKGSVVIRFYGTSNGWYSESVDFRQL